jgi:hypothetical protein
MSAPASGPAGETPAATTDDRSTETTALNRTPSPFILQPSGAWSGATLAAPPRSVAGGLPDGGDRPAVGIPIAREADPMLAALRASVSTEAGAGADPAGAREAGAASLSRADAGRGAATGVETKTGIATMTIGATEPVAPIEPTDVDVATRKTQARGNGTGQDPSERTDEAPPDAPSAPVDTGPCADQRRVAEERCAVATRARDGARRAAEAIRTAQRDYDEHVGQTDAAAARADARSVRTAKETAQAAFRKARAAATSRDAIETAARDWLTEINRINRSTRESTSQAELHRAAAAGLAPGLERLALEADAARISAESAEEACVAARETVATCEEAAAASVAAAHHAAAPLADSSAPSGSAAQIAAATGLSRDDDFDDDDAMGSRAGEDAAIIRLLRGDREILPRIVARLGGDDPEEQRRWRVLLSGLVEALVASSIEAASFDFPSNDTFWGPFTRAQCRDIAAALASLGYRHDGFGDWADERVPGQRDLSLAVGYAGLDPMRIRHWPTETEMRELLRDVTVAADEYIWEAAGALTLGELVSLLGRRADGLTDLWNDWGAVRPLLLAAG